MVFYDITSVENGASQQKLFSQRNSFQINVLVMKSDIGTIYADNMSVTEPKIYIMYFEIRFLL